MNIPRNFVNLTCFILLPTTCIKAMLILCCFPLGVDIIKFDFLVFKQSSLIWKYVEIFLYFYVYLFDERVEALKRLVSSANNIGYLIYFQYCLYIK